MLYTDDRVEDESIFYGSLNHYQPDRTSLSMVSQ